MKTVLVDHDPFRNPALDLAHRIKRADGGEIPDAYDPATGMGYPTNAQPDMPITQAAEGQRGRNTLFNTLTGAQGVERYQLWPERMVRETYHDIDDASHGRLDLHGGPETAGKVLNMTMLAGAAPMLAAEKGAIGAMGGRGFGSLVPQEATGIRAYHGSPHDFDRFDMSKIGTGEGAQSYGHGLYFAGNEGVARSYRDQLGGQPTIGGKDIWDNLSWMRRIERDHATSALKEALAAGLTGDEAVHRAMRTLNEKGHGIDDSFTRQPIYDAANNLAPLLGKPWETAPGKMYEVNIAADPAHFLDWDKPLAQQPAHVVDPFVGLTRKHGLSDPREGRSMQATMYDLGHQKVTGSPANASAALRDAGIPGIKYLDQGSRRPGATSLTKPQVETRLESLRADLANAEAKGIGQPDVMRQQIKGLEDELARHTNLTSNYVVFDDKLISILKKYGLIGALGGTAALTAGAGDTAQAKTVPVDHDPFANPALAIARRVRRGE